MMAPGQFPQVGNNPRIALGKNPGLPPMPISQPAPPVLQPGMGGSQLSGLRPFSQIGLPADRMRSFAPSIL